MHARAACPQDARPRWRDMADTCGGCAHGDTRPRARSRPPERSSNRRAPRPSRRSRTLGASASAAPRSSSVPGPLLRWLDAARGRPQAAPYQLRGEVRRGDDHVGRVRVAPQSALLHGQVTRAGSDPCGGLGLNAEGSQCPAQHFVPKGSPCLPHLAHVHPDSGPVGQRRPREAVRRRHQPCAISESRQARHCPREVAAA
eukprot:11228305-Lingulodinium_polyedra.AAC.2